METEIIETTLEAVTEALSESAPGLVPPSAPLTFVMPNELRVLLIAVILFLAVIFAALLFGSLFRR